jgi:hypothetical protein
MEDENGCGVMRALLRGGNGKQKKEEIGERRRWEMGVGVGRESGSVWECEWE